MSLDPQSKGPGNDEGLESGESRRGGASLHRLLSLNTPARARFTLTELLDNWPHIQGRLTVRRVDGIDGSNLIQFRECHSIHQFQLDNRPDNGEPLIIDELMGNPPKRDPVSGAIENWRQVSSEVHLCYRRSAGCFQLGDFDRALKDATRAIKGLELLEAQEVVKTVKAKEGQIRQIPVTLPKVWLLFALSSVGRILQNKCDDNPIELVKTVNFLVDPQEMQASNWQSFRERSREEVLHMLGCLKEYLERRSALQDSDQAVSGRQVVTILRKGGEASEIWLRPLLDRCSARHKGAQEFKTFDSGYDIRSVQSASVRDHSEPDFLGVQRRATVIGNVIRMEAPTFIGEINLRGVANGPCPEPHHTVLEYLDAEVMRKSADQTIVSFGPRELSHLDHEFESLALRASILVRKGPSYIIPYINDVAAICRLLAFGVSYARYNADRMHYGNNLLQHSSNLILGCNKAEALLREGVIVDSTAGPERIIRLQQALHMANDNLRLVCNALGRDPGDFPLYIQISRTAQENNLQDPTRSAT